MRDSTWVRRLSTMGFVLLAMVGFVAPAVADPQPSPRECAVTLRCDLDAFVRMPIEQRITFVRLVQRKADDFEPDFQRWTAIAAVLDAARGHGVGEPGSWLAVTGAGLLEAIERGAAVARDPDAHPFGNPGSPRWADYLTDLAAGQLEYPPKHDRAWSEAEQVSLDHGESVSRDEYGLTPTAAERRFKLLTDLGRFALRNQHELSVALGPLAPVLWWFTDPRNGASYRLAGEVIATVSFGPPNVDRIGELLRGIHQRCPTCTRTAPAA